MKNLICILLMLCPLSINITYAQNQIEEEKMLDNTYLTDLDIAIRLSSETKQNLVIIFSTSWCGHCRILKNDFPKIQGFDDKIVCILDSDVEKKIARKFKVKGLPTSVMLNPNGEEVSRIAGYEKEAYERWLRK